MAFYLITWYTQTYKWDVYSRLKAWSALLRHVGKGRWQIGKPCAVCLLLSVTFVLWPWGLHWTCEVKVNCGANGPWWDGCAGPTVRSWRPLIKAYWTPSKRPNRHCCCIHYIVFNLEQVCLLVCMRLDYIPSCKNIPNQPGVVCLCYCTFLKKGALKSSSMP